MPTLEVNIIADIGGTNMRVAQLDAQGNIADIKIYACAQYASLAEILANFIDLHGLTDKKINACLAIASPVDADLIEMTNLPWKFSQQELKAQLKLQQLVLINDFMAIAHAIPQLSDSQKVQIGAGNVIANKPISICGPGTGLGVANLVAQDKGWLGLSGEGGHVDFAPIDQQEIDILKFLATKYPRVSYEQLLSGLGLEQIYQALSFIKNGVEQQLPAKDITTQALNNSCDLCIETVAQFCRVLGSFAGNLALTLGSHGGVYIAGGIVPRFIEFLRTSDFRTRFEAKGRLSRLNQSIATFVVTEEQPGLIGAAAYLKQLTTVEYTASNTEY